MCSAPSLKVLPPFKFRAYYVIIILRKKKTPAVLLGRKSKEKEEILMDMKYA